MPFDGCAANLYMLDALLHAARTERRALTVLLLEFKNAFGSVKHDSIIRACQRLGLPALLVDYVRECYNGVTTTLLRRVVNVSCGVLQGYPLSPFLFNAVLDEILDELNETYAAESRK